MIARTVAVEQTIDYVTADEAGTAGNDSERFGGAHAAFRCFMVRTLK